MQKTNLDSIFKTSESLEKDGIWFDLNETTGFLIRPFKANNPRSKGALAKYYKPFARQIENETLEVSKIKEISINMFLDACLVDWKGVEIDGVETAYSRDVALPLFKRLPELFDNLWNHANDFKNYRVELGNS